MNLLYGFVDTAFGKSCLLFDDDYLYLNMFYDDEQEVLPEFKRRFPRTVFTLDQDRAIKYGKEMYEGRLSLQLKLTGTSFQAAVWNALLQIPAGSIVTYTDIANAIAKPQSVRAVANAIGANPIAWLIPCHRVIRSDGKLGGYRWGPERKIQMLKREGNTQSF
jgi:AraC family transcriptional regulator of adaptative response/methylated-DNA-[protein]-cysteine methyltransferase